MEKSDSISPRNRWVWPLGVGLLWFLFLLALAMWSARSEQNHFLTMAERRAKTLFQQMVLFRSWNAQHGGVYVLRSENTPPNPHLQPEDRTVEGVDGRELVMLNPAYMTRQLGELSRQRGDVVFHITGLDPVSPENLPDDWEKECLISFEHKKPERFQLMDTHEGKLFRYMAPLKIEAKCLRCHSKENLHGRKTLGGISVSFPAASLITSYKEAVASTHLAFTLIGLVGMAGIMGSTLQILRKRDEAQRANHAKSMFLANMSHDMRTPLNGIMGMTELMERRGLDETQKRHAGMVRQSAINLLEIVDDITEFSRLESGRLELLEAAFDFRGVIDEVIEVYSFAAESKGLRLLRQLDHKIPRYLVGDAFRIKQIVSNLVGNAVKFTPSGEVVIMAELTGLEQEEDRQVACLEIRVRDTGAGIPESNFEKIFISFQQADNSYSKRHVGTGLGLSICRKLIGMMGGHIRVESEPGNGATFIVRIRLDVASNGPDGKKPEDRCAEPVFTEPKRILVVEDNPLNKCFFMDVLQEAGHQVATASSGEEARQMFECAEYDLVFMDIQIPGMDGLEITRRIRDGGFGLRSDVPIVAVTASVGPGVERDCFDAGMSGYLKKPLTSRDLLSAVCKFADPALGGTTSPPEEEQKMHDATSSDVFDRDGALARLGGKRQLLQKLLDKFEEDAPAKIGQLAAAVADNDQPEVVRLAHALKNSAALIHAGRMSNMARDMESAADHGNMSQVKTLLEQLKSISRETLDTIRNSGDM